MGITSVSFLAGKQEAETLKWGQTSTHLGGLQIRKKLLPELSMWAPVSMLPTALCPCVVGDVWVGEDLAGTRGAIHCPGLVEGSHTFLPTPFPALAFSPGRPSMVWGRGRGRMGKRSFQF